MAVALSTPVWAQDNAEPSEQAAARGQQPAAERIQLPAGSHKAILYSQFGFSADAMPSTVTTCVSDLTEIGFLGRNTCQGMYQYIQNFGIAHGPDYGYDPGIIIAELHNLHDTFGNLLNYDGRGLDAIFNYVRGNDYREFIIHLVSMRLACRPPAPFASRSGGRSCPACNTGDAGALSCMDPNRAAGGEELNVLPLLAALRQARNEIRSNEENGPVRLANIEDLRAPHIAEACTNLGAAYMVAALSSMVAEQLSISSSAGAVESQINTLTRELQTRRFYESDRSELQSYIASLEAAVDEIAAIYADLDNQIREIQTFLEDNNITY